MTCLEFDCRHRFSGGFELAAAFCSHHTVTALFGPSGSGKTTVLSIIAGFLAPQHGCVMFNGRTLSYVASPTGANGSLETWQQNGPLGTAAIDASAPRRTILVAPERRRIGMVFQDHLLFPHLTVRANLRYSKRRPASGRKPIELASVVETLEIAKLLDQYPAQLSVGERQRVALGRALLSQPDLLLMDEPLASLDAKLKLRILAYLERVIAQWAIPVLFVSHSQAEVRRLAQWVVLIENGRVLTAGRPDDALSTPAALGLKHSNEPINLLRIAQIEQHGDHLHGSIGSQPIYVPGKTRMAQDSVFVQFSPRDVILGRQDVAGVSARNHLTGQVCQLVRVEGAVFVAVDIGQIVWTRLTPDAVAEMRLEAGSWVVCLLKAHRLDIVE